MDVGLESGAEQLNGLPSSEVADQGKCCPFPKEMAMAQLSAVVEYLDELLAHDQVSEKYASNGLQVEACGEVSRIGFCVDACMEGFEQLSDCQLIVVHHGLFWPNLARLTGAVGRAVGYLFRRGISLYASHLPLDAHVEWGNNAQLVKLLELERGEVFPPVGWMAETDMALGDFHERVEQRVGRARLLSHGPARVQRLAISSGQASVSMLADAAQLGADTFLTGEAGHPIFHASKEMGINLILAGHYATETWGVRALMPLLERKFAASTRFVDVPSGF